MADLLALLVMVALVAGVVSRRRWRHRRWRMRTVTYGHRTRVTAVKPPYRREVIAAIPLDATDYDQQLADAESEATMKCAALNASERANR